MRNVERVYGLWLHGVGVNTGDRTERKYQAPYGRVAAQGRGFFLPEKAALGRGAAH
jgi:hypothetical protein